MSQPPPPPPPPHGHNPRTTAGGSGLPTGKYDIFIIPEHSAGAGFLYLPSLRPQWNSFIAGVATTLVVVAIGHAVGPSVAQLWYTMSPPGALTLSVIAAAGSVLVWLHGRSSAAKDYANSNGGSQGGSGAYYRPTGSYGGSGSYYSPPPQNGPPPSQAPPPPPPPPPPPEPEIPRPDPGSYQSWHDQPEPQAPPTPEPPPQPKPRPRAEPPPQPKPQKRSEQPPQPAPQPKPQSRPQPSPTEESPRKPTRPKTRPAPKPKPPTPEPPKEQPAPPPPPPPPPPPAPEVPPPQPSPTKTETPRSKGAWEKAREETRKREEERKAKEAETKRREEAARRLKELREREAKEREQREREVRERETRERLRKEQEARERERLEKELREKVEKELREKAEQEAREREAREREIRERELQRQREREAREREEARRQEEERQRVERERQAAREKEAREARERKERLERLERERRERQERERQERERQERERLERERLERERLERERAEKLKKEEEEKLNTARKGSAYAFSSVGEKTSMWPNGKPPAPPSYAASTPSTPKPASPAPSPTKPTPSQSKPAASSTTGTEDQYSYRPYDKPKKPPARKKSVSDLSESSWAPSASTARTSPPPSMRGPYTTDDPQKIVIKAVYGFLNQFSKTPANQLVSGVGSVTDGLILRITSAGLFVDDDIRGVAQREWDVKAWTLKMVEVWCPAHAAATANSSNSSGPIPVNHPFFKTMPTTARRAAERNATKMMTGEEALAYIEEFGRTCGSTCRQGRAATTNPWKTKGLHVLRATIRDQEGKRFVFVVDEEEAWKIAHGLQALRSSSQVRMLGVVGFGSQEAQSTLETLGWIPN